MKNKSDTNLVRHYCSKNENEIFDVPFMQNHFRDITNSNLRKYVSRLVEERILTPISKGVYYIGANPTDEEVDRAIRRCYLRIDCRPIKETLLYKLGIIEKEPEVKTYFKYWPFGNKKVFNYQFIESKNTEYLWGNNKLQLLDLIACEKMISDDDFPKYTFELMRMAEKYNASKEDCDRHIEYPRWVYLRLANLLDVMHISNRVMQDYDNKIEASDRS